MANRNVLNFCFCSEPAYAYRSENSSPDSPNGNSTADLTKPTSNGDSSAKRKKQARAMEQLLASVDCNPPDYVMPGFKDRQLTPMHVLPKETNSKVGFSSGFYKFTE